VLDPLAKHVVGLNPLTGGGTPELRADAVLSIFTDLFGRELGPRTTDVLHASLLTLARQPDDENVSLIQIPRLLSDPAFRTRLAGRTGQDIALAPFWAWYNQLNDKTRDAVIAPLMNKLRAVILKPSIRQVIGQTKPKFNIDQVFREHKILLLPLPVASLGAAGAKLLGSLAVSAIWDAARSRALIPARQREPVSVIVDECQTFMTFATDLADALATSRSYGVGWTLAHQYLGQLTPVLREGVLNNCRSHIVFQSSIEDATTFAKTSNGPQTLTPADFTGLPAFHIYASIFADNQIQPYTSGQTLPPPAAIRNPAQLRAASTKSYGRTIEEIEAGFTNPQPAKTTNPDTAEITVTDTSDPPPLGRRTRENGSSDRSSGRVGMNHQEPASQGVSPAVNTDASSAGTNHENSKGGQP
jgi:hypothetical protein